ncbi:hypothetical protein L9F63_007999, partial [Diploptera punctata]
RIHCLLGAESVYVRLSSAIDRLRDVWLRETPYRPVAQWSLLNVLTFNGVSAQKYSLHYLQATKIHTTYRDTCAACSLNNRLDHPFMISSKLISSHTHGITYQLYFFFRFYRVLKIAFSKKDLVDPRTTMSPGQFKRLDRIGIRNSLPSLSTVLIGYFGLCN